MSEMKIDRQWYADRWASIPEEMRARIITHMREFFTPKEIPMIREAIAKDPEGWIEPYHHTWGMAVRNHLRAIIKDDELPSAPYPDGRGEYKNWDDYYVQAIEAVLCPPVVISQITFKPADWPADEHVVTTVSDDATMTLGLVGKGPQPGDDVDDGSEE